MYVYQLYNNYNNTYLYRCLPVSRGAVGDQHYTHKYCRGHLRLLALSTVIYFDMDMELKFKTRSNSLLYSTGYIGRVEGYGQMK